MMHFIAKEKKKHELKTSRSENIFERLDKNSRLLFML